MLLFTVLYCYRQSDSCQMTVVVFVATVALVDVLLNDKVKGFSPAVSIIDSTISQRTNSIPTCALCFTSVRLLSIAIAVGITGAAIC